MASVAKRTWTYKGEPRTAWVVRWHSGATNRSRQFELKKEASAFALKLAIDKRADDRIEGSSSRTLAQVSEAWLREMEVRVGDGRIGQGYWRQHRAVIDNWIIPLLGGILVTALTVADIETWYARQTREHRLHPRTARHNVARLGQILKWCHRRSWLADNPFDKIDLKGIERKPIEVFTGEQVTRLMIAAETRVAGMHGRTMPTIRCMVHLAASCGLRRGEIAGLTRANLDLKNRLLFVRKSMSRYDGLKGPKTRAGIRTLPLPPYLVEMLSAFIERWYIPNPDSLIFVSKNGRPLNQTSFYNQYWWPLLKAAGLYTKSGTFHFHALRHFKASHWVSNGIPLSDVAALLGHAKFDTTLQIYTHPVLDERHRAAAIATTAEKIIPDFLRKPCATPANVLKTKGIDIHLNQWTDQAVRWLPLDLWDACVDAEAWEVGPGHRLQSDIWTPEKEARLAERLRGRRCFGGLDLSSTSDITALVWVFPPAEGDPLWRLLPRFWVPADGIRRRAERDRVPYDQWARRGAIEPTTGNVVDYAAVKERIYRDAELFRVVGLPVDRWNATQIALEMTEEGLPVILFGQGYASMSAPSKELERIVFGGLLDHGAHPVLRWMAGNVAIAQDPAGNIKPAKDKSSEKIDGIVAAIMGLGAAMSTQEEGPSVYESRGILMV